MVWKYGGCASKYNISIIQRSQSKILRMKVDAPWYVSNATLHADLGISYVQEVIHQKCTSITLDSEPTKTRSSKHHWHHGAIYFQCNTTR
jgi:hypothetical protein